MRPYYKHAHRVWRKSGRKYAAAEATHKVSQLRAAEELRLTLLVGPTGRIRRIEPAS